MSYVISSGVSSFGQYTMKGFRSKRAVSLRSLSEINSHRNSLSWPAVQGRVFQCLVLVKKHIRLFSLLLSQRSRERSVQYCCTIGGLRREELQPPSHLAHTV